MVDFCELLDNLKGRIDEQAIRVKPGRYLADCPEPEDAIPRRPFRFPPSIGWDNNHAPCDYALPLKLGLPGIAERAERGMQPEPGTGDSQKDSLRKEEKAEGAAGQLSETGDTQRDSVQAAESAETGLHSAIRRERRRAAAAASRLIMDHIRRYAEAAREQSALTGDKMLGQVAENCEALCAGPPQTFCQGVQLIWFIYQIRGWHRSSLGRLDQALWPLYQKDILSRGARDEAFAILAELWENLNLQCSGDTLMNVMLGGVDGDGNDVSNDLSLLIMEVTRQSTGTEPHINVRIHQGTPEAQLREAARLIAMGRGQGVLYLDEALVPSFLKRGIPEAYARNYANDGCTEITFNGQSAIHFWQMEMMKTLELTLFRGKENPNPPKKEIRKWSASFGRPFIFETLLTMGHDSGDICAMTSFEQVYEAFLDQLTFQTGCFLDKIDAEILKVKSEEEYATSLILCLMCEKTLDEGIDPQQGGYPVENWQLLSGSIPTAADALEAVREVVFERKLCTMEELLEALCTDFSGREDLRLQLLHAPKFGNDIPSVDQLAADIARRFMDQVEEHEAPFGIKLLPGIYNIDFHMMGSALAASPDGRHNSDLIADHYSPTPGRAVNGPSAVMLSAAAGNLGRGCASSPLQLALPRGVDDEAVTRQLIEAVRTLKLPVVSLTFQDAKELEDAMAHPEKHRDLIVRVWGFNARFVELDEGLQRHILKRTLGQL